MGRNQKGIQESQNVKGSMNSGTGRKFRTSVKFRTNAKFSAPSFSASAPSFFASAPFLLILICNVEFDSNSSCLDRIDNLGINSLQNYKISHKIRSVE